MASKIKKYVVFSLLLSPNKFKSLNDPWEVDHLYNDKKLEERQELASFDFGHIEYNPFYQNLNKKSSKKEKENYIDIIRKQCNLPKIQKQEKVQQILFILIDNNKKSLREFSEWVSSFWSENEIPYITKDGKYRLYFSNKVGIQPKILKQMGFKKTENDVYVYTGGKKMSNERDDEMLDDNMEENEKKKEKPVKKTEKKKEKPVKKTEKKKEKPVKKTEKKEVKLSSSEKLEMLSKVITKFLKSNLKNGVLNISAIDLAKALKLEELPKGYMKKLQTVLEEKFASKLHVVDKQEILTVWKPSKKRVPLSAMKI